MEWTAAAINQNQSHFILWEWMKWFDLVWAALAAQENVLSGMNWMKWCEWNENISRGGRTAAINQPTPSSLFSAPPIFFPSFLYQRKKKEKRDLAEKRRGWVELGLICWRGRMNKPIINSQSIHERWMDWWNWLICLEWANTLHNQTILSISFTN